MGEEHDPLAGELVEHEAVQPDDDLHILADGADPAAHILLGDPVPQKRGEIPARPDDGFFFEDGEDSAQDQDGVHPVETGPGEIVVDAEATGAVEPTGRASSSS